MIALVFVCIHTSVWASEQHRTIIAERAGLSDWRSLHRFVTGDAVSQFSHGLELNEDERVAFRNSWAVYLALGCMLAGNSDNVVSSTLRWGAVRLLSVVTGREHDSESLRLKKCTDRDGTLRGLALIQQLSTPERNAFVEKLQPYSDKRTVKVHLLTRQTEDSAFVTEAQRLLMEQTFDEDTAVEAIFTTHNPDTVVGQQGVTVSTNLSMQNLGTRQVTGRTLAGTDRTFNFTLMCKNRDEQ